MSFEQLSLIAMMTSLRACVCLAAMRWQKLRSLPRHGHDEHRSVGVTRHVVADAAEHRLLDDALAARADDDHVGVLVVGDVADRLARVLVALAAHLVAQLSSGNKNPCTLYIYRYVFTFSIAISNERIVLNLLIPPVGCE